MPFRHDAIRTTALALAWATMVALVTVYTWQATQSTIYTLAASVLCRYLDYLCARKQQRLLPVFERFPGSTAV